MKLFDRKVLWQIESQGKGGHLFLLGCWKKGQQQFNEPNLYRNFLLVTKWLFRARKVGPLWPQLIGGIDLIFPGTLPLNVTFKLPVSEISEIDDHKSVGFTISLHSFLHTFIPHICHFFTHTKFLENKIYTEKRVNYDKLCGIT